MLYIVATPIGNMAEITFRAVEVLNSVSVIAAEDTRRTSVLLHHYHIDKPLITYQKFNEKRSVEGIIGRLKAGEDVALVSDAGMPLISDPGHILVEELIKNGLEFTVVSGPSALVNAVVLSGLDTGSFCMAGFLPEKNTDRVRYVGQFKSLGSTLIFYSPPHDVLKDLDFLYCQLGKRRVSIIREISKMYEQIIRGHLGDCFDTLTVKGEFVLVVEGDRAENQLNLLTVENHIRNYTDKGIGEKDAYKLVARDRGVAKSVIYNEALRLKENGVDKF